MPVNRRLTYEPSAKRMRTRRGQGRRYARTNRTQPKRRIWPYQRLGWSQYFDPFPSRITAVMRYSTSIPLVVGAAGLPTHYLFRANSIFDPDFSGIGHQPYGHDTYQSIYNHYFVKKATITMTPVSQGEYHIFGISLTDDAVINSNYDTVKETKGTVFAPAGPEIGSARTITQEYKSLQHFGGSDQGNNSLQGGSSFGDNPTDSQFFDCWVTAQNSSATQGTNNYQITITYIVECFELKDLGQS